MVVEAEEKLENVESSRSSGESLDPSSPSIHAETIELNSQTSPSLCSSLQDLTPDLPSRKARPSRRERGRREEDAFLSLEEPLISFYL